MHDRIIVQYFCSHTVADISSCHLRRDSTHSGSSSEIRSRRLQRGLGLGPTGGRSVLVLMACPGNDESGARQYLVPLSTLTWSFENCSSCCLFPRLLIEAKQKEDLGASTVPPARSLLGHTSAPCYSTSSDSVVRACGANLRYAKFHRDVFDRSTNLYEGLNHLMRTICSLVYETQHFRRRPLCAKKGSMEQEAQNAVPHRVHHSDHPSCTVFSGAAGMTSRHNLVRNEHGHR